MTTTTTTFDPVIGAEAAAAAEQVAGAYALSLAAKYAAGVRVRRASPTPDSPTRDSTAPAASRAPVNPIRPPTPPSSIQHVIDCIKAAESGDYAEHSHPATGSGAYQFIPKTWRTYAILAGFSHVVVVNGGYVAVADHQYAFEASPAEQDVVLIYALTHGGAHNWDPAYGNDSCTVGMP